MADQNKIAEMLESLLNNEQSKAEELFHEYVVEKSREIYENLIDSEIEETSQDEEVEEAADEEVEESSDDEDLEENFEEVEEGEDGDEESDDPTDKFMSDVETDGEEEEGEEGEEGDDSDPATKGDVQDLSQEIQQLQAAFDAFMSDENGEEGGDMDMGGELDMPKGMGMGDSIDAGVDQIQDLATVREYTEKIGGATYDKFAKGGDNGANAKSPLSSGPKIASNGASGSNLNQGGEGGGTDNGLLSKNTKDLGVNDPKAAAKGAFKSKVAAGHGAEKKGAGETGTNTASLFRGK